jgi:L-2-deoxyfucosyltransferase/glycosyltransferase DesVII
MRVLLASIPWRSHFNLLVSMGWALQAAGHDVRVASGPELTEDMTRSGLTVVPVGSDEPIMDKLEQLMDEEVLRKVQELGERGDLLSDMSENREEELTWERLRWAYRMYQRTHAAMNDAMIEDLVRLCRRWQPDLVIWDSLTYAGSVAATAVGAAHARMPIGLNVEGRMRSHYLRVRAGQAPEHREDPLADWLGGWAEKFGSSFTEDMVTGQFTIEQMVGSLRLESTTPHLALGYVPYNGPSVVPDWIRRDPARRRILATFGYSLERAERHQAVPTAQLQEMLDALADLDIELVVTLPRQLQQELERVPGNTRMVEFVPLHVVIPSCAVVIHHGGIGPFLDSIVHEVPQLALSRVVPDMGERGPRLEQAGAGLWIPGDDPQELSGARIREHVVRLLDEPEFRTGAARLREELLAQPTPAQAVRQVESLARRHRAR